MLARLFAFKISKTTNLYNPLKIYWIRSYQNNIICATFSKGKRNDAFWEKEREKEEDIEEEELSLSDIVIPKDQVETNFSRSSGAGGQHVNKVNTKAEIRFNVTACNWLTDEVKERLRQQYKNSINSKDELIVTSQVTRTQSSNLEDCFKKMQIMIYSASLRPKAKKAIIPAETEREAKFRLENKRQRSDVKKNRNSRNHDW